MVSVNPFRQHTHCMQRVFSGETKFMLTAVCRSLLAENYSPQPPRRKLLAAAYSQENKIFILPEILEIFTVMHYNGLLFLCMDTW